MLVTLRSLIAKTQHDKEKKNLQTETATILFSFREVIL